MALPKPQEKIEFPKIKGLTWVSDKIPDLVVIKCLMENAQLADLGLPCDDIDLDLHVDLKSLVGMKDWYEKGSETPSPDITVVDFNGMAQLLLRIEKTELIKAWLFIKTYYS